MDMRLFMAGNALPEEKVKFVASKRFQDAKGKPVEWEIVSITTEEDEAIRKACIKRVPMPGKRRQFTNEVDYDLYLGKLAARCTVFPDLKDKALQDSYQVIGEDALLKKMLKPGEYAEYLLKVQAISGFDEDFEETVDDAKN